MFYKGETIIKVDERYYIEKYDSFIEFFTLDHAKEFIDYEEKNNL